MHAVTFEHDLDRLYELGYFENVKVFLKEDGPDDTGEMTYKRNANQKSDVVKKIYIVGEHSEIHIIHTGGYVSYAEPGEEIELLATTRHGRATGYSLVKPTIPVTSPYHRAMMTFQRVAEIRPRDFK